MKMAGGEKAKSSGEYGEKIVKNLLELFGWKNCNSGVTVPCVYQETHKKKGSEKSEKHGIDYVFQYKSPLRDATKHDVLISVKCRDGYPKTEDGIKSKFKEFLVDIAFASECYPACEISKRKIAATNKKIYSSLIFWIDRNRNDGREKEILEELYRVTRKYLILREPCYEFAGQEARARMKKHGYVTKLYQSAQELGYEIETYGLFHSSPEDRNPSGLMIIRKECSMEEEQERDGLFACPVSQKNMKKYENPMGEADYYCPESMLVYPIIQGVPCSTANNAVVATKYLEDFDQKANAEQKGRAKWQHTKKVINGNGGWWNYLKSAS